MKNKNINMKNLYGYKDFFNESKKDNKSENISNDAKNFNADAKNLMADMFDTIKKLEYAYDDSGFAIEVTFKISDKEYNLDYSTENIEYEYDDILRTKREFLPILVFVKKLDDNFITFEIKKEEVDKDKYEKDKKNKTENVKNVPDNKLLNLLKSKKIEDSYKEKIIDELIQRGVDYDDPFEEKDDSMSEEDIEKLANKEAKKKKKTNESVQNSEEYYKENRDENHIDELLSDMGLEPIMNTQYQEDFENSDLFSADMTDEEYANAAAEYINSVKNIDEQKNDKPIVEGFIGKIAKFLNKSEYEKTLNYVKDCCKEDCTKDDIKACINKMVFSKITKKELSDDSSLMTSLVDELYKDFKKNCEKCESFGTPEWAKKYGIILEEEKKEYSLEYMVNESLNIKPENDQTLEDIFNKIYEEYKLPRTLETIKKENK